MKSNASFFDKRNYCVNLFFGFFAVYWAINGWMLNTGYCGTQGIKFQSPFRLEIPFYQTGICGEGGNFISKFFFAPNPSTSLQFCAANFVTPSCHKSQKSAFSVGNSAYAFAVNVEPMRDNHGQDATKGHSADGFASSKNRLNYLWWHFLSGFLGGMIALQIWIRRHQ